MARLPAIFIGHGSPHNLVERNPFTDDLRKFRLELPTPQAIVLISAHWTTKGTLFTADQAPKQIFDFYGFPKRLYDVIYEPPGQPELAITLAQHLGDRRSSVSQDWGIDHAATIPLVHLFPKANVPVVEMSLDMSLPPPAHYQLGKELARFREDGVLFIGSGNLIHTFRELAPSWDAEPFEWAVHHDERQWRAIQENDVEALVHFERDPVSRRAFQTTEHYLPLLYVLGMRSEGDMLRQVHQGFQHGSISHRSVILEDSS
jgi:4,5-DOPA dioxygenase extradiol